MPYFWDRSNAHRIEPFLVAARAREAVWRSLGDLDITDQLGGLRVPTLVVHGRHDPIPLESAECLAAALHGNLSVFEFSGHLPFIEEPDLFVSVLDEFLPREHE
jgi:pimeloyl-ACP methyl ester carboxylesterase